MTQQVLFVCYYYSSSFLQLNSTHNKHSPETRHAIAPETSRYGHGDTSNCHLHCPNIPMIDVPQLGFESTSSSPTFTETETEEMMLRAAAAIRAQKRFPLWVRSSSSSTHRTAGPALHSGDIEGSDPNEVGKIIESQDEQQTVEGLPPKKPIQEENHHRLHQSSLSEIFTVKHKLESHPVDPNIQQKRDFQSSTATDRSAEAAKPVDMGCIGFDGTPLSMDDNEEQRNQDDKEYFKDRKPSALSEIEIADTRKPITRASDGTADSFDTREIEKTGWREEQIDTAEEALRRASMIWKEAAMRGDPDAPQSRALRQLLPERG